MAMQVAPDVSKLDLAAMIMALVLQALYLLGNKVAQVAARLVLRLG